MTSPPVKFIQIGGVRLEYYCIGDRSLEQPTLVFLHEGLGSASMWKEFPMQLVEATGFNAFVYSRRGYGQSDPAVLPRQVDYMHTEALEVLPKLLDAVGIEQTILVGHSDGGSIALIFAATDPEQRTQGIVLLAPHVFNETLCVDSIAMAKDLYKTTDLRKRLAKYHADVDHTFWGWNDIWLLPEFMDWNIESYLPEITVPVLYIQGENDQYGTIAQANAVKQQCRGPVSINILPDCTHSAHLDQPDRTISLIQTFIKPWEVCKTEG